MNRSIRIPWLAGMTMIELLIVMAIISILIGLGVPAFGKARRQGQVRATEVLIGTLTSALTEYYSDWNELPPSTFDYSHAGAVPDVAKLRGPAPQLASVYTFLNGPDGNGFNFNGRHYGPYLKGIPAENLRKTPAGTVIVDAWGHPLSYQNCQAHLQAGGSASLCHNKLVDIYSVGPDGRKDPGNDDVDNNGDGRVDEATELVDDITNW